MLIEVDGKCLCVADNIHMSLCFFFQFLLGGGTVTSFPFSHFLSLYFFFFFPHDSVQRTQYCFLLLVYVNITFLLFLLFWMERIYYFLSHFFILMFSSFSIMTPCRGHSTFSATNLY